MLSDDVGGEGYAAIHKYTISFWTPVAVIDEHKQSNGFITAAEAKNTKTEQIFEIRVPMNDNVAATEHVFRSSPSPMFDGIDGVRCIYLNLH